MGQSGINAAVVRIRERDALLREACRLALQVGGYEHVVVSLVEPDGGRALPWYRLGMNVGAASWDAYPIGDGIESDTSLIGLASAFNLIAVAEGVETEEQLELLRKLKCNHSQGFLHSRPIPAAQLEQLLERQVRRPKRRDLN